MENILVTGAAISSDFSSVKKAVGRREKVGFDNMNSDYDVRLKESRLNILKEYSNFIFIKGDLADKRSHRPYF